VQTLPSGNSRNSLLGNIVNQWVQQDSAGALEYVQTLPAGAERNTILQNASVRSHTKIHRPLYNSPRDPSGSAQMNVYGQIANGFANSGDTKSAIEWIQTLPEGRAKQSALQNISWQMAQTIQDRGGLCIRIACDSAR